MLAQAGLPRHSPRIEYFAYGTLKSGFPNHGAFAAALGPSLGDYRTVERYPLAVPREPACANPGCRFVHRMGVLLPDAGEGEHVEGELFSVDDETLARLDELEGGYVRRELDVEPAGGGEATRAFAYFAADAAPWRRALASGAADAVARYTLEHATGPLKPCCVRDPGHSGPHDVVLPPG